MTKNIKTCIVMMMHKNNNYYQGGERRKFPRASARVIYAVLDREYLGRKVYTRDISPGGMSFISADNVEPDTLLSLSIVLPKGHCFEAKGRVLRKEEIRVIWSAGEQYKVAVEFIDLPESACEKISSHISKHQDQDNSSNS